MAKADEMALLKARIADVENALRRTTANIALLMAACPARIYGWEHPDTCEKNCDKMDTSSQKSIDDVMAECWELCINGQKK